MFPKTPDPEPEVVEQMDTDQSDDPNIEAQQVMEQLQNLSGNCDDDDDVNDIHNNEKDEIEEAIVISESSSQHEPDATVPQTDENSSTFPFGDYQNDTIPHDNDANEIESSPDKDSIDFVASLAVEENANSLPPATTEDIAALTNEIDNVVQQQSAETGSSDNALAEEMLNGDSDATTTKADPDAEMVSEDELPQPEKEVVKVRLNFRIAYL